VHLKTGGTSIAFIIIENRWRVAYRKETGVELDYESTGSTTGLKRMIDKKYAIAFTHAPMSEEQRKKARAAGGEVVHIPVVLCAVVPVYNLPLKGKEPLKFNGEVLGDIFLGKIDTWNDPALQELNRGVELPKTKITVVHREDSSGTTLIFTDYLAGASSHWREAYGDKPRAEVEWKTGVGKPRNEGVARHVEETEGAIGYVDLIHATGDDIPFGAVENREKAFVRASAESMTAAARGVTADLRDDLTFALTNKPGRDAYPICGAVWAVCYRDQPAADQKKVVDFLRWVTHDGQNFASKVSYAPLPDELVERVDAKITTIRPAQ
jgi:phosphate transport system substrate-binding protein